MQNNERPDDLKKIESGISQNLFFICAIVTLATMGMMTADFFSRGSFLPARMNLFYLSVLLIYSLHKELVRWLGEKKNKRNGEFFVYAWVLLTTALYVVNFWSRDYFSYSREGYPIGTLRDISVLTVEILGIFLFTRFLKLLETVWKSKTGL
ncbi:MAG: hypothetical protein HY577_02155 [Candidatus Nealsonbacteria bacterium]|nr:hypothetical protein [Candidatus Nealsonbacteria bacterium]